MNANEIPIEPLDSLRLKTLRRGFEVVESTTPEGASEELPTASFDPTLPARLSESKAAPEESSPRQVVFADSFRYSPAEMNVRELPLSLLAEADWNANRVPPSLLAKIRRSIAEFGVVENLVARPHPALPGMFEVISGNHRLRLLRELEHETAPVVVVELDDAAARLLAQTLNRTRGADDPAAYAKLLEQVLEEFVPEQVTEFLPETESSIDRILREYGTERVELALALCRRASPVQAGRAVRARVSPSALRRCDRPRAGRFCLRESRRR